jgi:hypothetical protein
MTGAARSRIQLAIIAVLAVVLAAIAYKFIVAGSTREGEDGRIAITLEPGERAFVLREMRGFVAGLQQIAEALSRDDMQAVATASRALGYARAHDVPVALLGKLPLEFKTLAFATHGGFDRMAAEAEANGTTRSSLAVLAATLQNCGRSRPAEAAARQHATSPYNTEESHEGSLSARCFRSRSCPRGHW